MKRAVLITCFAISCGGSSRTVDGSMDGPVNVPDGTGANDLSSDGNSWIDGAVNDAAMADAHVGDAATGGTLFALVGSGNGKVFVYTVNTSTAALTAKGSTTVGTNPSWLAADTTHNRIYSVNEATTGQVIALSFDPASGGLTEINRASSGGAGPAHLSIDASAKNILVANYTSGSVSVLPIQAGGGVATASDTKSPGANSHMAITNPSGGYVFVPCLGADIIAEFSFNAQTGKLTTNGSTGPPSGAGPRHLAFHPNEMFAYGINETASTLTTYAYNGSTGTLSPAQTISTLPSGYNGSNTAAEVLVHPNGQFVYGSNRGQDSIAIFSVNAQTKQLTLVGSQSTGTGGTQTPRSIAMNSSATLIYAANQAAGTVTAFRIETSGMLTPLGQMATVPQPAFVGLFQFH